MATASSKKNEYDFDVFSPEPYDDSDMATLLNAARQTDILKLDEERGVPSVVHESEEEILADEVDEDADVLMVDEEDGELQGPQMCEDGVLDEDTVGDGLSNLGRSAEGTFQVYLNLKLPGLNIRDITVLGEFVHLQKVELPYNEITDLSALSSMPYLLELDASHNQIDKLLDFKSPKNLKYVDLSFNNISEMRDLSEHHYLSSLILDNNDISKIQGIDNCKRLSHLSLAHNKIQTIEGIQHLPISYLNLGSNDIQKIQNLETLKYLQEINLSRNRIRSLQGMEGHEFLEIIDIEDNEVIDMLEVQYVKPLKMLRRLNLKGNPIQELPEYRLSVLYHVPQLSELDTVKADVQDKVAAQNTFNPPMEVIAARDHIMHVVYSFLQPNRIYESTLPSTETPYPMLVLVGPMGSGKKDLTLKLVEEFPDYFGYGISHTTRKPGPDEEHGRDYNFCDIEQFEMDVKMGKFLQTYSYYGNLYGLTIDAVETIAREGLACIVHMELEGVLTLKNTHLEPRYVLIMPLAREAHQKRLVEKGTYTQSQMENILDKAEIYAEYNRQHPGFFDMFINSDDLVDAYKRLRRLVMDYLGMSPPSPTPSDMLEQSHSGSMLEKEDTIMTAGSNNIAGSANMGARTWSKLSITDSAMQPANPAVYKATSPVPTSRGVVEAESLKRRQSAAKEAMSGHRPTLYDQIVARGASTVPQPVSAQMGLGEEGQRSYSAPAKQDDMDALPVSPDSSNSSGSSKSSLSNISEAYMDNEVSNPPSPKHVDPLELSGSVNSKSLSTGLPAPRGTRPPSGVHEDKSPPSSRPSSSGRLGSAKHKVLPPIGSPQPIDPLPDY